MVDVFEYLNYRVFLRDAFEHRKESNKHLSYRFLGKKVLLDPGFLVKVHQEKAHISISAIPRFVEFYELEGKQVEYFEVLVRYGRSKSPEDMTLYFEKLVSIKGMKSTELEGIQYAFYQKWYHSAIRSLIGTYDFKGDYSDLAMRLHPKITKKEAEFSVNLLLQLGLIYKNDKGIYNISDTFITTGTEWKGKTVRDFQRSTLELAKRALDKDMEEQRDISTLTIAATKKDLEKIRIYAKELREKIGHVALSSSNPDSVFQVNIQVFPLTNQEYLKGDA